MIDLHCHMLPGIDDGAPDMDTALAMARLAADDGIELLACTPHIYPGLYENTGPDIRRRVGELQAAIDNAGITLKLTLGADTHLAPDLVSALNNKRVPTLADSRYFLLEPPHHVQPPRLEDMVFSLLSAGYVPLITHPERLTWISRAYPLFARLVEQGAWMQITAGSLTGRFGPAAQTWGERFLTDGLAHLLATDGHSVRGRPPLLAEGRLAAARLIGDDAATDLVVTRPRAVVENLPPEHCVPPTRPERRQGGWRQWLGRR